VILGPAPRRALVAVLIPAVLLLADLAALVTHQEGVTAAGGMFRAAVAAAPAPPNPPALVPALASVVEAPPTPPAPAAAKATTPRAPAPSPRLATDFSSGWEQRRGQAALALITYPWQQLGYQIVFMGARPGLLGGTIPEQRLILVFIRSDEDVNQVAHTIAHELGHAVDKTYNDDTRRQAWLAARGLPETTDWFTCNYCADFTTGSGDFAESFAAWQTGDEYFKGQLAPPPTPAQIPGLERFFNP